VKPEKGKCKLVLKSEGTKREWDIGCICPVLIDMEEEMTRDLMIASLSIDGDALNIYCLSEADALKIAGEIAEGLVEPVQ